MIILLNLLLSIFIIFVKSSETPNRENNASTFFFFPSAERMHLECIKLNENQYECLKLPAKTMICKSVSDWNPKTSPRFVINMKEDINKDDNDQKIPTMAPIDTYISADTISLLGSGPYFKGDEDFLNWHLDIQSFKWEPRSGLTLRGVEYPESVAAHSWGVALSALINPLPPGTDRIKVIMMAIIHDMAERILSDASPEYYIPAETKRKIELNAMEDLLSKLPEPARSRLNYLWQEYNDRKTLESKIVKEIDRLDWAIHINSLEIRDKRNMGRIIYEIPFLSKFHEEYFAIMKKTRDERNKNLTPILARKPGFPYYHPPGYTPKKYPFSVALPLLAHSSRPVSRVIDNDLKKMNSNIDNNNQKNVLLNNTLRNSLLNSLKTIQSTSQNDQFNEQIDNLTYENKFILPFGNVEQCPAPFNPNTLDVPDELSRQLLTYDKNINPSINM